MGEKAVVPLTLPYGGLYNYGYGYHGYPVVKTVAGKTVVSPIHYYGKRSAEADPGLAYGYHGYGHGLYRPYGYRSYWGGYPYGGYRYGAYGYCVKILISAQMLPKCVQRVNLSILNLIYQRV